MLITDRYGSLHYINVSSIDTACVRDNIHVGMDEEEKEIVGVGLNIFFKAQYSERGGYCYAFKTVEEVEAILREIENDNRE